MNPLSKLGYPRLKLATTYLIIIMIMSISFSLAIYDISEQGLRSQRQLQIPQNIPVELRDEFNLLRTERFEQARKDLRDRLVIFNLFVLAIGTLLSYGLARKALEPIEQAMSAQDRFTSDASHEMRTPLTVMRSELEVALRDNNLNIKDAKEVLDSNLEEVKKLESLTNGLLQLARQENVETSKETVNVDELVKEVVAQIKPKASAKKIKITKTYPKKLQIHAEPQTIKQAVIILLDNAVKYSPEKSEVELDIKNSRSSTVICVKDSGPGIDQEDFPHIFKRFYRSDKARTKEVGSTSGYGLGLSIANQIVKSHGGDLNIWSKKGQGTKASIIIPKK